MPETLNTVASPTALSEREEFDYSFVNTTARIALYDDLKAAPRVLKIEPARTADYIEHLAATVDEQAKRIGGKIPYTVIREVSENFIHAQFREIVVSILDGGNTIRFADQGPGIQEKEKAQKPGFTSATEPMKEYIRGVGSGLPLVRDYLGVFDGSIVIEDNLNSGAVVTISLVNHEESETEAPSSTGSATSPVAPVAIANAVPQTGVSTGTIGGIPVITTSGVPATYIPRVPLSDREQTFLKLLFQEGELGITDLSDLAGTAPSTTHNTLKKLAEAGLVQQGTGKKRTLTPLGTQIAPTL